MKIIASPDSWKHQPFGEGVALAYHTTLDAKQFQQVQSGVVPEGMEGKWFVYYEEPYLYFHRSSTGQAVYRLTFEERDGTGEVVAALVSTEFASAKAPAVYTEVRMLDFLLYAVVLHEAREFPVPEGLEHPKGLFQHVISGTAYPESCLKAQKD